MNRPQQVPLPLDVRLVAKIGLSVAAVSFIGLMLVILLVSEDNASGYAQMVGAFGAARQSLGPAMLAFGLAMVGFAGIAAWLFSLYASFRIAGPLYRISRNLELQIERGSVDPMPIRADDSLQSEWKAFEASVAALRAQHDDLARAIAGIASALQQADTAPDSAALQRALQHLKQVEQRVRL